MRRGVKPPVGSRRRSESAGFGAEDLAGEMLAALHGLGPRDLELIALLIVKVRQVEAEHGEAAAREVIDAISAILLRRGLSRDS